MTSFEEILNYFKLINSWLNSKLCAERKSLHPDENAYVLGNIKICDRAMKLDASSIFQ